MNDEMKFDLGKKVLLVLTGCCNGARPIDVKSDRRHQRDKKR